MEKRRLNFEPSTPFDEHLADITSVQPIQAFETQPVNEPSVEILHSELPQPVSHKESSELIKVKIT